MNNNLQQIQADIIDKKNQLDILKNQKPWTSYIKGGFGWGILGTLALYGIEMVLFPFMELLGTESGFIFGTIQGITIGVGRYFFKTRKARKILRETDVSTLTQEISQLQQLERGIIHGTSHTQTYTNSKQNTQTTPTHVGPTVRPSRNYNYSQSPTPNQAQNNGPQTQPSHSFQFNPNQPQNRRSQTNQPTQNTSKTR